MIRFKDLNTGRILKGNRTPHGSYLEIINGVVFRRTSDLPSKRYIIIKSK